jgi:predicted amidophosphoribosyltransferase
VLLVDDVATTGATIGAAAAALRDAGAERIIALTAARTPG